MLSIGILLLRNRLELGSPTVRARNTQGYLLDENF